MLRTRLWMGAVLAGLAGGVLIVDQFLGPWYPILLVFILALALPSCGELLQLLGSPQRPAAWLCYASVAAMVLANWPAHVFGGPAAWMWVTGTFTVVVLSSFLVEMATFREPGASVARIAQSVLIAAYLGWLPSFLLQLRWPAAETNGEAARRQCTVALALAIF